MSEQWSRGLAAFIDGEARTFGSTPLGEDPDAGVAAVGRARRRRAAGIATTSVAAVAVVAFGATLFTGVGRPPVAPAGPSDSPETGVTSSANPAPTPTAESSERADAASESTPTAALGADEPDPSLTTPLDVDALRATATPRGPGDAWTRDDAQAALTCTWDEGDSPREAGADIPTSIFAQCPAVWVGDQPLLYTEAWLTRGEDGESFIVDWTIINFSGDESIALDEASATALLEVDGPADAIPQIADGSVVGTDLWLSDTERATAQTSETRVTQLPPNGSIAGSATISTTSDDVDSPTRLILDGAPFTVSLQIRAVGSDDHQDLILESQDSTSRTLD